MRLCACILTCIVFSLGSDNTAYNFYITKNILYEKVGGIGFESNSGVKERKQGSNNKGKCSSPIFSTFVECYVVCVLI